MKSEKHSVENLDRLREITLNSPMTNVGIRSAAGAEMRKTSLATRGEGILLHSGKILAGSCPTVM